MENENIKNFFSKDEETCLSRLNYSQKGDEIIIAYPENEKEEEQAGNAMAYNAYVAIDNATFRKARIFQNRAIRLEPQDLNSDQVLEDWKSKENRTVRWNRKKFTLNEVDRLKEGKNLDYGYINERYNPLKKIADMQLAAANFLQTVTPRSEVNYYKYQNGKPVGVDSYLCTKRYEFMQLKKKIINTENRERSVEAKSPELLTVWDIVNTLPKNEQALSPEKDINIRCKWNKYDRDELADLKDGKVLNDTAIEERRQKYLQSNHYFVPAFDAGNDVRDGTKPYVECWVHKDTEQLVFSKDVRLSLEQVTALQQKGRVKQPNEIPGLKMGEEKQQVVNVVKRPQQGMQR